MPVGSLGALRVQTESGPLASSTITSAYDCLSRLSPRTAQGAGAETFQYDAIGRLSVHTSDLGTFNLSYLGQTNQITSRQLASSTLATTWSYALHASALPWEESRHAIESVEFQRCISLNGELGCWGEFGADVRL